MTSLVVWWSELLTTNHEVPGSIPGSTMGIFPCRGRILVVTMVWVVSRVRLKAEASVTRSHNSNQQWLNPRQRSPRWRGLHHERQPAHHLIEYLILWLLITEEKKKSVTMSCRLFSSVWILNFHAYPVGYILSSCHPSWFNQLTNTRVQTTKSNLQCYIWIWPTR